MNATSVLTELFNKGVHVSTQDDELVVDAPKGALEESDVKLIREHRDDIVELLRQIQLHRETPEPARRVGQSGRAPLSAVQQNVLLMESLAPGTPYAHIPLAFAIEGQVDHDALARALADIVAAHEILRTTYVEEGGGRMVQSINAPAAFAVELEDLSSHGDPQTALESTLARHETRLFDLAKDRPLRALLVKLGEGRHVLSLVLHQIAVDGHSCQLLLRYLSVSYARAVAGVRTATDFMGYQYADFADWQARNVRTPAHAQSLEYWRTALRGAPPLHAVPGDFVRPATQRFAGRTYEISLSADDYARVEAFARDYASSVFTVLQAVFALLVSRYGGEDDVVLGTAVANRTRREFFGTLGNLVNTIPLRFDLAGRRDFVSLVEHARAAIDAAMSHQHVPFNAIVDEARPARSISHNPLVQLMLVIQEEEQTRLELEGCRIEALFRDPGIAKFDLTLHVYKQNGGAALRFEYATTLFRERTIARFSRHFVELLRRCIAEPECELATLPLSTKEDEAEQPVDAGRYPTPVCVHELIARQVRATPERVAVRDVHGDLTYAALDEAAEKVAAQLRAHRPSGGELRVAVCTERCSFLVIAMYATLKAGGVYVPLDSEYPVARLEFMLADSGATLVLAQGVTPPSTHLPVLDLPSLLAQASEPAAQVSGAALEIDAPAYVIYTSGSTGRPKGVLVSHRSLFYSLHANRDIMGFARTDAMPCIGSQAFGVSLLEILIPLVSGASVRMLPRDTVRDLDALIAATQDATVLHAVPSLMGRWLQRVQERRENAYPKLRLLLVGGEAVPDDLLRAIARWRADIEVIELYGMTETAVVCASYRPDASFAAHHCIGRPHPTTRFRVLNAALQEQPVGVPGELHIGGLSLATEYLNQPELTSERFIADPFTPGARLYKTGDRVRRLHDGQFEFLGRVDHQVSLRGVRIELGEIEALLATHPAVKKAVAHVVTLANGEPTLVAWYTTFKEPQDRVGLGESLREHLARDLPDYMRPALYQHLDALPLNPNGKVDRRQLPAPVVVVRATRPATPTERAVAALWAELLALPEVDAESNFFDIGGNSLLATQLVNQARKHFSVDLPVTALFESPTVRELARAIDDRRELVDLADMVYDSRDAALAEREIVL
jgi:amino acid adenylation domain-containing protein